MSPLLFLVPMFALSFVAALHPKASVTALALWGVGLLSGGLFLSLNYEALAVVQWIMSTVSSLVLVFYSNLLGENREQQKQSLSETIKQMSVPVLVGLTFSAFLYFGMQDGEVSLGLGGISPTEQGLFELGKTLVQEHFLSVQVLGLMILLMVIGTGVIIRPEPKARTQGVQSKREAL